MFVPAVNPNVDGGDGLGGGNDYWRLSVTNLLPQISGANGAFTTIDGTAYGFTYGATGIAVRNDNAGTLGDTATRIGLGADAVAGTGDDLPLSGVARPELEIADGVALPGSAVAIGLDVNANDVAIRDLAIWGFGTGVQTTADISVGNVLRAVIEGNVIGSGAGAFFDPGAERSMQRSVNVDQGDDGIFRGNLIGFSGNGGLRLQDGATGWLVEENEFRSTSVLDPSDDAIDGDQNTSGTMVQRNLFIGNYSPGVHFWQNGTSNTVTSNTFSGNAAGVTADVFSVGFDNPGANNIVSFNVITGGNGPGVMVREGVGGRPSSAASSPSRATRSTEISTLPVRSPPASASISAARRESTATVLPRTTARRTPTPVRTRCRTSRPRRRSRPTVPISSSSTSRSPARARTATASSSSPALLPTRAATARAHGTSGSRDVAGGATFSGTLAGFSVAAGEYVTMTATRTNALAPTLFFETSEFSAAYLAAAVFDVSGTIYEDVEGDSVDGAAPADWVGRDNVRVRLFRDGGDGVANGTDDTFVTSTLTGAGGTYTFANQAAGTYWVVVDSRTITPSAGVSIANQVWAEQTYGTAGAWGGGLTPTGVLATSGALYGGRSATASDNSSDAPASLLSSDHVTRVAVAASDVTGVDSAFSFNVVTNVRGDGADDDGANARLQQGSLHQFILNANAMNGANAMVFVPVGNPNVTRDGLGGGNDYWRVTVTSALGPITGAFTTVDGTAHSFTYGASGIAVRDDNTGLLGAGGTVGVGGAATLSQVARPELEIVDGAATGVIDFGLNVQAADVTIRDLAIYGFGDAAVEDSANIGVVGDAYDRVLITGNLVGFSAGAATFTAADADPGATRSERHAIHVVDADNGIVQNNLVGFVGFRGITLRGVTSWTVEDNEIRGAGQSLANGWWYDAIDVTAASSNTTIEGNLITGNRSPGIDINNGATTSITVIDNTITNNATTGSGEEFGVAVRRASNVVVDGNVISGNTGSGVYVVRDNAGTTTALVTGNQITGNTANGVLVEESGGGTTTATITQNTISGNGGLGIDLGNNGVTANDLPASWVGTNHDPDGGANDLQNFPVIASASSNGATVTLNWSLEGSGSNTYRVEFFASPTADASGYGEGQVYLGARDIQTTNGSYSTTGDVFNVAVTPGWVITATATRTDALVPTQFFETSEFSAAVGTASIGGRLWEDVNGNGAILDDGVGVNNVDVRLYRDNLSAGVVGAPDAADILVGSAITSGGGLYAFSSLATGTYWVIADSTDVLPAAGTAAPTSVWAEQTYGADGAATYSAGTYTYRTGAGAHFGGLIADRSDDFTVIDPIAVPRGAEHITRVQIAGASATNVDSGFSFSAVTNARGDNTDDDGAGTGRLQQGSLRQFVLNSNVINGVQTSDFSIAGGGAQTITLSAALSEHHRSGHPRRDDAGRLRRRTARSAVGRRHRPERVQHPDGRQRLDDPRVRAQRLPRRCDRRVRGQQPDRGQLDRHRRDRQRRGGAAQRRRRHPHPHRCRREHDRRHHAGGPERDLRQRHRRGHHRQRHHAPGRQQRRPGQLHRRGRRRHDGDRQRGRGHGRWHRRHQQPHRRRRRR